MYNIAEALRPLIAPIDSIKPDSHNARKHDDRNIKTIKESLSTYGQRKPIVANHNGIIEAGNGLWQAAKELGWTEIAVVTVKDDVDYAKGFGIMDNKSAELAEWSMPDLKDILESLDTGSFDMKATGFSDSEIEELMTQFHVPDEGLTDDDEIPEKVETICKTGDLWQLGENKLLCGNATKKEDVERLMGGEKAVLMATDPPYGDSWVEKARDMHAQGYVHSLAVRYGSIASDEKTGRELKSFLASFLMVAKEIAITPFPFYIWHGAKRIIFEQTLIECGYFVHQPIIWVKPSFVIGRLHYHPRCELALHGWIQGIGKCPFYGKRNQSDIWEIGRENDGLHPTQKPVALFEPPISNHTKSGEICYEPFAGSGTQVIACEKLGRRCYMLEIDISYTSVIIERWTAYTGKDAVREDGRKWSELKAEMQRETKTPITTKPTTKQAKNG